MPRIAIFASGEGTNAEAIIRYFQEHHPNVTFSIWSNRAEAGVLKRAKKLHVPSFLFTNDALLRADLIEKIKVWKPDLIVLAGFLRKIPDSLIQLYPNRILNIHPALLPKFGGKGMYGQKVHEALKKAGETETGITIHLVNEVYDEGKILFQERIPVLPQYTAEDISREVRKLELLHYPRVVAEYLNSLTGAK
jgi:phosphoribosylglycinamide formyltransferase-1